MRHQRGQNRCQITEIKNALTGQRIKQGMDKEQQRTMKAQLVAHMEEGYSWRKAVEQTGIQMSRSAAYRLRQSNYSGDQATCKG